MADTSSPKMKWSRVLLKLSGEAFAGDGSHGVIDYEAVDKMAAEVAILQRSGVQTAIVIGGGNVMRGQLAEKAGMKRITADHIGMLGTVVNGLALQDSLEQHGIDTRVQTAVPIQTVAEPYINRRALRHLEKGRVVILAGGTGNPFFTTDTAASLRAIEIGADLLLKATKVDGIYTADPKRDPSAKRYTHLTFDKILTDRLEVMDDTAIVMCRDNNVPLQVFNLLSPGDLIKIIDGQDVGTVVSNA